MVERWPELVARNGHEIVGHGWSQDDEMVTLDEAEDLDVVRRHMRSQDVIPRRLGVWRSCCWHA